VNGVITARGALALSQGSLSDVVRGASFLRTGVAVVLGTAPANFEALFSESTILVSKQSRELGGNGEFSLYALM
jgi:hypothetical protein